MGAWLPGSRLIFHPAKLSYWTEVSLIINSNRPPTLLGKFISGLVFELINFHTHSFKIVQILQGNQKVFGEQPSCQKADNYIVTEFKTEGVFILKNIKSLITSCQGLILLLLSLYLTILISNADTCIKYQELYLILATIILQISTPLAPATLVLNIKNYI